MVLTLEFKQAGKKSSHLYSKVKAYHQPAHSTGSVIKASWHQVQWVSSNQATALSQPELNHLYYWPSKADTELKSLVQYCGTPAKSAL